MHRVFQIILLCTFLAACVTQPIQTGSGSITEHQASPSVENKESGSEKIEKPIEAKERKAETKDSGNSFLHEAGEWLKFLIEFGVYLALVIAIF